MKSRFEFFAMFRFLRISSDSYLARTINVCFVGLIILVGVFSFYFYSVTRSSAIMASGALSERLVTLFSQNAE